MWASAEVKFNSKHNDPQVIYNFFVDFWDLASHGHYELSSYDKTWLRNITTIVLYRRKNNRIKVWHNITARKIIFIFGWKTYIFYYDYLDIYNERGKKQIQFVLYGSNTTEHLFSTKLSNGLHITERGASKWTITSIKADNIWVFKFAKKKKARFKSKKESKKIHCQKLDQQSFQVSYVLDVNNSCGQINDFLWTTVVFPDRWNACMQTGTVRRIAHSCISQTSSQTHTEDEKVTQW